ncbi:MAG TPA: prolyl oligopeptidase family serine peptidase [Candidatus Limnocylindrales bacterium]|nr:prolyl oligopeptidase family serine peptidase [Candidatus Limnocylindrales bacterium]
MSYPQAQRLDLVEDLHGRPVADPYRWLEDPETPATRAWSAAQGDLFRRERDGWVDRGTIGARLAELARSDTMTLPRHRGGRTFYANRGAGQEHAVLTVLEADGSSWALLSPIQIDPSGSTTLEAWHPSIEGDLVAYQLGGGGTEEALLRVMEVDTGRIVDGPIDRVRDSMVAWLPGGAGFYYVRRLHPDLVPPGQRQYHRRVYLHRIGTDPSEDILIFGDGRDKADFYAVSLSIDGRWLRISVTAGTARRTDIWLADIVQSGPERPDLRVVQQGVDARTVPYIRPGTDPDRKVLLLTDRDAPRGRVATTTLSDMDGEQWPDLVGEDPTAVLTDIAVLDGPALDRPLLLALRARHAVSEITIHDLADGHCIGAVALPGKGTVTHLVDRIEGGHEAWFDYSDFTTPRTVYRFDARTGEVAPWLDQEWPKVPEMVTRQMVYHSPDGTPIRMFILSTTGAPDHPRPLILSGYGGFGVCQPPDYIPQIPAWIEAGGVYAIANVRGGGEEGEDWHRAGILDRKQNSFDDFVAAADFLVAEGWTTHSRLGVYGGSNGGLLVGAALTQHPEKFAAAVCSAPLLDMVRYEHFGLGPSWRREFGTAADPRQLDWLLSYSPYHRVRPGIAYPAVLFTVFDGDTRVDPLHARKLCAALQHASTSGRPVLIRAEGDVGHSLRALSRAVELLADTLAFFTVQLISCVPAQPRDG